MIIDHRYNTLGEKKRMVFQSKLASTFSAVLSREE